MMGGTHKNPYKLTKALTKKSYGYRALRIIPSNEKREKNWKNNFPYHLHKNCVHVP
jgi:hypothetical protein